MDLESNDYQDYLRRSSPSNSFQSCLESYGERLASSGCGKRNSVSPNVSKTYVKQITFLMKSFEDINCPDKIYCRLNAITGSGAESTKNAYLATLQNFSNYLELNFPDVHPKTVHSLVKHVDHWLKRQRQKKRKKIQFL